MIVLDLDPFSFRDWMAGVGLLRLVSETTETGRMGWQLAAGRYRLSIENAPEDLADRCSRWVASHCNAWGFCGQRNVSFDDQIWRDAVLSSDSLTATLWSAIASDGVWHRDGKKLKASGLEYAHGGGHQHWLASLSGFLNDGRVSSADFSRVFAGQRDETMLGSICRWDPICERDHALRGKSPTSDPMTQDQTINALAAIGLASCPSAPNETRLLTPLVERRERLSWPIWTALLRIADLEASLCCGWDWPTVVSRRWLSGKLYCFARGELREPAANLPSA